MARVALLCWEIGDGLGHTVSLLRAADALKTRGWSCVFALPPHRSTYGIVPPRTDVRTAPRWGEGVSAGLTRTGSSASMADMLADIGLRSAEWTRAQIIGWHLRFAEMMPDIVIADHAPGAVLAARGRIPCAAIGTGFSIPPAGIQPLPALHDLAPIRDDEIIVRDTVNSVLARFGSPAIASLAEALTGDLACVCTVPLLDPYDQFRPEPVLGPLLSQPNVEPDDDASGIVCYFQPGRSRTRLKKLANCLRGLPGPVTLLIPGLQAAEAELFSGVGVAVRPRADKLGDLLRRCRLMVHTGGHGMAAAALFAGIPQVILHYDIEKELSGSALARRGVARQFRFDYAAATEIRAAISEAFSEPSLQATAKAAAIEHVDYARRDVAARVAELCQAMAKKGVG